MATGGSKRTLTMKKHTGQRLVAKMLLSGVEPGEGITVVEPEGGEMRCGVLAVGL